MKYFYIMKGNNGYTLEKRRLGYSSKDLGKIYNGIWFRLVVKRRL